MPEGPSISYADAGVSIAEAERATAKIRKLAQRTFNRHVLTGIGSFGAAYALGNTSFRRPVLISATSIRPRCCEHSTWE